MSEIWTPGGSQPKAPSGGIELPSGFSRRRDPKPEPTPEAAPAAAPAPEQAAPPARQPGKGKSQVAFPPQGAQIQCPQCGDPFVAPIFSIVDLGMNPELRGALLSGQINVANCQKCGFSAPLSAPLMLHDPEHEFLGVFMPAQAGIDDMQAQQVIGEMTRALMAKLTNEQRRGYMLAPKQYGDWDRFMEKMWEFEGITPEMRKRQRDQVGLIDSLLKVAGDETATNMVLERNNGLIDAEFLALLGYYANTLASQGATEEAEKLQTIFDTLVETTEAGAVVKRQRAAVEATLAKITPEITPDGLVDVLAEAWQGEAGQAVLSTLFAGAGHLLDYNFLMALSARIDGIDATDDADAKASLNDLRETILQFQEEMQQESQQSGAAAMEKAGAFLQEVLQSMNVEETLRANPALVGNAFFSLLQNQMQQAEAAGAKGAMKRLASIYEKAIAIMEENMPADVRLINRLLSTNDEGEIRKLLQENRAILNKEFLDNLRALEERSRQEGQTDLAARLKSVRGKAALMQ